MAINMHFYYCHDTQCRAKLRCHGFIVWKTNSYVVKEMWNNLYKKSI